MNNIIAEIEKKQKKTNLPSINIGDTVIVSKEITEGKKSRIQKTEGIVVKKQGGNSSRASIVVRKLVDSIGMEKSFLIHSPLITSIEVTRRGKVRRARLFYLRDRIGKKATRIKAAD